MIFSPTPLGGVYVIDLEPHQDERGFFARTFCQDEFRRYGLATDVAQCSVSFNPRLHTLRGMHYQAAPAREVRLVRCTMGAIYDVVIDLRGDSATRLAWLGVELSADNRRMLYVPEGCAHGFLTLADRTEVFYQMSQVFRPECAAGVRWNDPAFGVVWPAEPAVISERDAHYPDYAPVGAS